MAGVAKQHYVDGRWTTVAEMSEELGLKPQQLYNLMHHNRCGLQTVVRMVRENLVLHDQGRAARHMVDGKWMTVRQAAEMLGVSVTALKDWMYSHKQTDGQPAMLADAVRAYREKRVTHGGSQAAAHRVGKQTMTAREAAEKLGVSVNAVRLHMYKHKTSLAATIRYYEKRKLKKAEKDILAILMEGRS